MSVLVSAYIHERSDRKLFMIYGETCTCYMFMRNIVVHLYMHQTFLQSILSNLEWFIKDYARCGRQFKRKNQSSKNLDQLAGIGKHFQ